MSKSPLVDRKAGTSVRVSFAWNYVLVHDFVTVIVDFYEEIKYFIYWSKRLRMQDKNLTVFRPNYKARQGVIVVVRLFQRAHTSDDRFTKERRSFLGFDESSSLMVGKC